jgi:hypothetical protein
MSDPLFPACGLAVLALWVGAFWLLNHAWGAQAPSPVRTDPGREAVTALTQLRPFPSGHHRAPSPGAEFEARRRNEAA